MIHRWLLTCVCVVALALAFVDQGLAGSGSPGSWEAPFDHDTTGFSLPPYSNKMIAVHLSLIPKGPHRGKLLLWDYHGNQGAGSWSQRWSILDVSTPGAPVFDNFDLVLPSGGGDFFCAGHAWDAEGNLLVAGGTEAYPGSAAAVASPGNFLGGKLVYSYDPASGSYGTWNRLPDLEFGRWYPTVTLLGNNQLLVLGGSSDTAVGWLNDYEAFDPQTGSWQQNGGTQAFAGPSAPAGALVAYARVHLLSTGDVFSSGMAGYSARLDHLGNPGNWTATDRTDLSWRDYGSSFLLPNIGGAQDLIVTLGGEGYDDLGMSVGPVPNVYGCWASAPSSPSWDWVPIAPLNQGRMHTNVVLLPDASFIAFGGRTNEWSNPVGTYTYTPEMFDWSSGTWVEMADAASYHDYHATAMLLPDGRVLLAGGEARSADYEVFSPPYLTGGQPRPSITVSPAVMNYWLSGPQTYTIRHQRMTNGDRVEKVVLMRPGSTTHHSDFDTRYVELIPAAATRTTDSIKVYAPFSSNVAPRGYYMMFLVSKRGIPSVAQWVKLE
jgi:hypothetical protein